MIHNSQNNQFQPTSLVLWFPFCSGKVDTCLVAYPEQPYGAFHARKSVTVGPQGVWKFPPWETNIHLQKRTFNMIQHDLTWFNTWKTHISKKWLTSNTKKDRDRWIFSELSKMHEVCKLSHPAWKDPSGGYETYSGAKGYNGMFLCPKKMGQTSAQSHSNGSAHSSNKQYAWISE